jgi:uncharacterized membrane protein HdeD (DUF308 family)
MIDLRLPIGIFFILVGIIMIVYAVISPAYVPHIKEHINIDLYWGILLLIFGIPMTFFGWAAERKAKNAPASEPKPNN